LTLESSMVQNLKVSQDFSTFLEYLCDKFQMCHVVSINHMQHSGWITPGPNWFAKFSKNKIPYLKTRWTIQIQMAHTPHNPLPVRRVIRFLTLSLSGSKVISKSSLKTLSQPFMYWTLTRYEILDFQKSNWQNDSM